MIQADYDVIILGGGGAGIVSGVAAGALGLRVLLIEKNRLGGECLNTGCVPSKALVHAAKVASLTRRGSEFGLEAIPLSRESARGALDYVRRSIIKVRDADATEALLHEHGVRVRYGSAEFTGPDTLTLDGAILRARHFIVATGSSPARPPIPGFKQADCLTNEEIFSLPEPPESLAIVGAGPIGVEMAQAFQRLGVNVTLVEALPRILPKDDTELVINLESILRGEGVDIRLQTRVERVETAGGMKRLHLTGPGESTSLDAHEILFAVGRRPNTDGLNLTAAGVEVKDGGIRVDSYLHTTGPHVWACGDVTGAHQFSHVAEYEAKLLVQNLFLPFRQKISYRTEAWATFTDPELAHVGLTEKEARGRGIKYEVLRHPFSQDDRANVEGEGQGMVKILVTRWRGKILGAQILGPRAGELIQEFVLAMRNGLSIRDIADAIHVYPTLTVASQRAAQHWYERRAAEPAVAAALSLYRRFWSRLKD